MPTNQSKLSFEDIMQIAVVGIIGLFISFALKDSKDRLDVIEARLNAPIVKKEINISLRDTIINDNAHLSIINIDNVEYLYLRNGKDIQLIKHK